jgi:hypothetical protein
MNYLASFSLPMFLPINLSAFLPAVEFFCPDLSVEAGRTGLSDLQVGA